MSVWERLMSAGRGTLDGWRGYSAPETPETLGERYAANWALYTGTMFDPVWQRRGIFKDERIYRNTRLVYKPVAAIVDFYASTVYQGQLSTDGKPLPDGSLGAIPLDPQVGRTVVRRTGEKTFTRIREGKDQDEALLIATAELWSRWKFQRSMRLRPRYAAALGDCLTQLVDDPARHAVWPQLVWPGYVTELELDIVGDIKAYTLEYGITREEQGRMVTFRYRKEVDKNEYRYFRDDRPWTSPADHGDAVQENPYGFVPAIWDRHKTVWGDRGLSAIAGIRQALFEYNSFLSHAIDYQRKPFSAPVLLKGSQTGASRVREVLGPGREDDASQLAETMAVRKVGPDSGYEYLQADIGKTIEILKEIKQGILEENPEASFYHDLRQMSQLTGPAVERALGDAVSRANEARAEHDPQTVKLFQMAITMCGMALNNGRWESPTTRDEVFRPFTQESFTAGSLDMGILGRPVVPMTEAERLDLLVQKVGLGVPEETVWEEMGYGDKIAEWQSMRTAAADRAQAAFSADVLGSNGQ